MTEHQNSSAESWGRPLATIHEAEIERVALAIERQMFALHELPLDAELHGKYRATAVAALMAMPIAAPAQSVEVTEASAQLVAALRDIEISAYNAAKFRIGKAIALLACQPSPAATGNKKTRCESCNLLEPCADPQCPNSLSRSSAVWCPGCSREVEGVCHHFNCAIGPNGLAAQARSSAATGGERRVCEPCGFSCDRDDCAAVSQASADVAEANLAELTDGHLALDRLGAAREEENGIEVAICERINEIAARLLVEPQTARAPAKMALRAIYEWYDRDGSAGGASEVFEANRDALNNQQTSADALARAQEIVEESWRQTCGGPGEFDDYAVPLIAAALSDQPRPIETAPKDGTDVLLFEEFEPATCKGYWHTEDEEWRPSRGGPFFRQPTHWMPVPSLALSRPGREYEPGMDPSDDAEFGMKP